MEGMELGDQPRPVHTGTLKVTFIAWGISERSKRGSGVLRFRAQKHHLSKSVENRGEPGWMEAGRPVKRLEQKYR